MLDDVHGIGDLEPGQFLATARDHAVGVEVRARLDRADLAQLSAVEKEQVLVIALDTLLHRGVDPEPLIATLVAAAQRSS